MTRTFMKEIEEIFDEMWEEEIKINLMKTIGNTIKKAKEEQIEDIIYFIGREANVFGISHTNGQLIEFINNKLRRMVKE